MLLFTVLLVLLAVLAKAFGHDNGLAHVHKQTLEERLATLSQKNVKVAKSRVHDHKLHTHEVTLQSGKKVITRCGSPNPTEKEIQHMMEKATKHLHERGFRPDNGKLKSFSLQGEESTDGDESDAPNDWIKGKDTPFIVHKGKRGFKVPVRYIVLTQEDGSMPGNYYSADGTYHDGFETLTSANNLELQTQILNAYFGKYGWEFTTDSIVSVNNTDAYQNWEVENMYYWFSSSEQQNYFPSEDDDGNGIDPDLMACAKFDDNYNVIGVLNSCTMKEATRDGGMNVLNVWISSLMEKFGLLGYATFPFISAGNYDGVVMDFSTLPNGGYPYNEGKTLVHEAGHWLGLLHTFQGGCSQFSPTWNKAVKNGWVMTEERGGDFVADTPAEKRPYTSGCAGKTKFPDTCSGKVRGFEGRDPVHNIMDYGYDECMTDVTDGQFTNAHMFWRAFREPRDGICYQSPNQPINECKCHASCSSCGYYDWPIKNNDCITCTNGSPVVPEHSDGTGRCNPVESHTTI